MAYGLIVSVGWCTFWVAGLGPRTTRWLENAIVVAGWRPLHTALLGLVRGAAEAVVLVGSGDRGRAVPTAHRNGRVPDGADVVRRSTRLDGPGARPLAGRRRRIPPGYVEHPAL